MDLINFPDPWVKIIGVADAFNQELTKNPRHAIPHPNIQVPKRIGLDSFDLINNEFVLSADFTAQLKSKHSLFTENETHNTALKYINTLTDSLVGLRKLGVNIQGAVTLKDLGYYQDGNEFGFDASDIIAGIKKREYFTGLSPQEKIKFNKNGYV